MNGGVSSPGGGKGWEEGWAGVSRSLSKWARTGGSLRSVLRRVPCSAGRGSWSVTAGGGLARLGVALVPLPHLLQLSGPFRLNEHQQCPVAEWMPVREWGVSVARPVVVPLLRAALASLPPGRAAPPIPRLGRGRAAPPSCSDGEN